eukprot:1022516-Amphidinium_carterae.1
MEVPCVALHASHVCSGPKWIIPRSASLHQMLLHVCPTCHLKQSKCKNEVKYRSASSSLLVLILAKPKPKAWSQCGAVLHCLPCS